MPIRFFSTWTNFVCCIVNYEVWRKGSGRHLTFQNVLFGQKRHWFLLSIFFTIAFLSTIDYFMNNNIINQEGCLALSWTNKWVWLSLSGALASWGIVLLHQYCKDCLPVRILEVMVAIASIVINGYVVANFTGDVQCRKCFVNLLKVAQFYCKN